MAKNHVVLYYDLISPWAYVAYALLRRYRGPWDLELELRPAALGYIFKYASNRAPLHVPNKAKMMVKELRLFSDFHGIQTSPQAWTTPPDAIKSPPNSLPLMRLVRIIQDTHPDQLGHVTTKLFDEVFGKGNTEIFKCDPEALAGAIGVGKLDRQTISDLLSKAGEQDSKERIQTEAKKLVEEGGAYGVPWLVITRASDGKTESFMGSDRFELIAHWLGVQYPVAKGGARL